jgi:hypothetical protein
MLQLTEEFNVELPFSKIPPVQLLIKKETVQKYIELRFVNQRLSSYLFFRNLDSKPGHNVKLSNSFRYSFLSYVNDDGVL